MTGANTSAAKASSSAEAFVANTRQNSGSDHTAECARVKPCMVFMPPRGHGKRALASSRRGVAFERRHPRADARRHVKDP